MNKQKLLIVVIAIVVVGLGIYLYLSGNIGVSSDRSTSSATLSSTNTGQNPVSLAGSAPGIDAASGAEIASLLSNISRIELKDTIFSDPAFLSLTDSSITLPPVETPERANPFLRTGAGVTTVTTSATKPIR